MHVFDEAPNSAVTFRWRAPAAAHFTCGVVSLKRIKSRSVYAAIKY
jgi:hypothetical protein